jgi:hypothetical protein
MKTYHVVNQRDAPMGLDRRRKMLYLDEYLAKILMDSRIKKAQRETELDLMVRRARLAHEGGFSRQRRRLMRWLGQGLMDLGERLKRQTSLQPLTCAGPVTTGSRCE